MTTDHETETVRGPGAPEYETTITHLDSPDHRGLRIETRETITTTYAEMAPIRGEDRPWSELDDEDRRWWTDWLVRYHTACVTLAEHDEGAREMAWQAYHIAGGDAESALAALDRAVESLTTEDA